MEIEEFMQIKEKNKNNIPQFSNKNLNTIKFNKFNKNNENFNCEINKNNIPQYPNKSKIEEKIKLNNDKRNLLDKQKTYKEIEKFDERLMLKENKFPINSKKQYSENENLSLKYKSNTFSDDIDLIDKIHEVTLNNNELEKIEFLKDEKSKNENNLKKYIFRSQNDNKENFKLNSFDENFLDSSRKFLDQNSTNRISEIKNMIKLNDQSSLINKLLINPKKNEKNNEDNFYLGLNKINKTKKLMTSDYLYSFIDNKNILLNNKEKLDNIRKKVDKNKNFHKNQENFYFNDYFTTYNLKEENNSKKKKFVSEYDYIIKKSRTQDIYIRERNEKTDAVMNVLKNSYFFSDEYYGSKKSDLCKSQIENSDNINRLDEIKNFGPDILDKEIFVSQINQKKVEILKDDHFKEKFQNADKFLKKKVIFNINKQEKSNKNIDIINPTSSNKHLITFENSFKNNNIFKVCHETNKNAEKTCFDKKNSKKESLINDKIFNLELNEKINDLFKKNKEEIKDEVELLQDKIYFINNACVNLEVFDRQKQFQNFKMEEENNFYQHSYYYQKYNPNKLKSEHILNYDEEDSRSIKSFINVYDSFSEEEVDETLIKKPIYIINPDSKFKIIFDLMCSILIFYSMIVSPYQMAFEEENMTNNFLFYVDFSIDIFFIFDLILNFFTAFKDNKDELVYNFKRLAIIYLKSWFLLDFLSCIPFTLINYILQNSNNSYIVSDDSSSTSQLIMINNTKDHKLSSVSKLQKFAKIARFYRLIKWTRILRILKITKSSNQVNPLKKLDEFSNSLNRFLQFLIFFIILTHISSCLWCFIGKFTSSMGDSNNWINSTKMNEFSNIEIYIGSIYFILTTIFSIGYGDITAKSIYERVYVVFIMMIGCFLYSYVITSLSNIMSKFDMKTQIYNKKESLLNEIKLEYKINQKLYDKIKRSLRFDMLHWNEDRITLIDSLPTILRNKLYLKMYEKKITHLIFFNEKSYDFITYAVSLLRVAKFSKNDSIISYGELIDEMYMTISGTIGLQLGSMHQRYEICEIPKGYHFGDILMYTNQQSKLSYIVKSLFSHHFVITKVSFAQLKLNFKGQTCKNLEYSYIFFCRIEKIRNLAIEFFERHKSFGGFRFYLKKILNLNKENDENISDSKDYLLTEYEDSDFVKKINHKKQNKIDKKPSKLNFNMLEGKEKKEKKTLNKKSFIIEKSFSSNNQENVVSKSKNDKNKNKLKKTKSSSNSSYTYSEIFTIDSENKLNSMNNSIKTNLLNKKGNGEVLEENNQREIDEYSHKFSDYFNDKNESNNSKKIENKCLPFNYIDEKNETKKIVKKNRTKITKKIKTLKEKKNLGIEKVDFKKSIITSNRSLKEIISSKTRKKIVIQSNSLIKKYTRDNDEAKVKIEYIKSNIKKNFFLANSRKSFREDNTDITKYFNKGLIFSSKEIDNPNNNKGFNINIIKNNSRNKTIGYKCNDYKLNVMKNQDFSLLSKENMNVITSGNLNNINYTQNKNKIIYIKNFNFNNSSEVNRKDIVIQGMRKNNFEDLNKSSIFNSSDSSKLIESKEQNDNEPLKNKNLEIRKNVNNTINEESEEFSYNNIKNNSFMQNIYNDPKNNNSNGEDFGYNIDHGNKTQNNNETINSNNFVLCESPIELKKIKNLVHKNEEKLISNKENKKPNLDKEKISFKSIVKKDFNRSKTVLNNTNKNKSLEHKIRVGEKVSEKAIEKVFQEGILKQNITKNHFCEKSNHSNTKNCILGINSKLKDEETENKDNKEEKIGFNLVESLKKSSVKIKKLPSSKNFNYEMNNFTKNYHSIIPSNNKGLFLFPIKQENKFQKGKNFIKNLSEKISHDAFLYKNKEVLQMYIKNFLDQIGGESIYKRLMNRLKKLEMTLKQICYLKNYQINNLKKSQKIKKKISSIKFNLKMK